MRSPAELWRAVVRRAASGDGNQTAAVISAVTATPVIQQQIAGLTDGGTYTFYIWARVASGTRKVSLAIVNNAYAAYLAGPTQITLTTSWQRFKVTGTLASGETGLWIVVRQYAANGDDWITGDIHLWGACLQQGNDPEAAYARTWASQTPHVASGLATGPTVIAAPDSTTSPLKIHGPGSNLADNTLLELTANGELILAGGSGNGYRFAELAAANNPSGWSGVLKVKTPAGATLALYYVDELTTDLWASINSAIDAATDPVAVVCTVNPDTQRVFRVGDFVVFNDESADPENPGRRSYECAQIIGPGAPGDVVPSGEFHLQRAYPGVPEGQATFGTLRCGHLTGMRFYKLDQKTFTFSVRKGFFRTPDLPARIEAKLPSACIVAALAGVANHFGYGPFTVFPLSRHNEPYMPGLRTCNGGAYTFQVPGPLTVQENVVIPMKVQDAASIRCVYAYLQRGTTDGQSAFLVKINRDGGGNWEPLEYMGIALALPDAYKTTYDFLVNNEGLGLPATRRLPYADYGLVLISAVTAAPDPQTLQTASYGANRLGLVAGGFVFLDPGGTNEEYVRVVSVDPDNQTFEAIVTKDHAAGERIRPTIWPTPVLNEGDDLAFDILAVASPDPGSDLTLVIQT